MPNAHKRYNNIDQLLIQGVLTQDSIRIQVVEAFYQNLYTYNGHWRLANLDTVLRYKKGKKVPCQRYFEEDEILNCLKFCAADRSPRPNGFTMDFFHQLQESSEAGHHGSLSEL